MKLILTGILLLVIGLVLLAFSPPVEKTYVSIPMVYHENTTVYQEKVPLYYSLEDPFTIFIKDENGTFIEVEIEDGSFKEVLLDGK